MAEAKVPALNAHCGGNIDVHADEGGPVYINGSKARLKKFNDNYYEAAISHITISISDNGDGTHTVSYTGRHGANGICTVTEYGSFDTGETCPPDVSEANRYMYPACN